MQVSLETQDHKFTVPHVYSPNSIILESECFTFYSCPYIHEQESILRKCISTNSLKSESIFENDNTNNREKSRSTYTDVSYGDKVRGE